MPMILAGAGVLVLAVGGWLAFGGGDAPPPPVEVVAAAETPPEVKPEPAPEVKPEPAPVETAEVKPEPVPEPVPEPAPETAPGDAPVPEAETEIAAVAAPPAETPADTPVTPPASEQAPATAEPAAQAISPPADQTAAVAAEPPAPAPKPGKRDFDLTEAVGDLGQPEAQEVALAAMPIPEIISAPAAPIATMDAASADGSASVDLAAPEAPPAPEPEPVPEPQPEPQPVEASAVEAKVTVNLPFQAASGAANVIGALNANADEWMIPGQKIVTVNNVEIAAISEIPAILEATGALRAIGEVPVSYGIAAADGSIVVRSSTVKVAKSVSLKNGMIFELRTGISGEETVVISAPSGGEDQIRVGDVVIGYVTTNERLSPDLNIADLLNREIAIGNTTHTFAVRRGEFNTVVTLQYDGTGR